MCWELISQDQGEYSPHLHHGVRPSIHSAAAIKIAIITTSSHSGRALEVGTDESFGCGSDRESCITRWQKNLEEGSLVSCKKIRPP